MRSEWLNHWAPRVSVVLALVVVITVAGISRFGYLATQEWKLLGSQLLARQARESADLLVTAISRDMRGAQSVLASRDQLPFNVESLPDTRDQVASAFARYPYPESFFGWHQRKDGRLIVFNRADRRPHWFTEDTAAIRYPVEVVSDPPFAQQLRQRIQADIDQGLTYSVFETELLGHRYQVVSRLQYNDPDRTAFDSALGYIVNLEWVATSYFGEIASQVSAIGDSRKLLRLSVSDDQGQSVTGTPTGSPMVARTFPLLFFDPSSVSLGMPPDLPVRTWRVLASPAGNPTLSWAERGADWALVAAGTAVLMLALSLVVTVRIIWANATMAEMRADFVSTVTHELRTPLATIHAVGDTLVNRRVTEPGAVTEYASILVQEAKQLTRLVNNLLAYARVTDIIEVYSFERIVPAELVEDVLRGFRYQLQAGQFDVVVDVSSDLPVVRADRQSIRLALDNLVDNAIRYAGEHRWLRLSATQRDRSVLIDVQDRGAGIPAEELPLVQKKFVRGKLASPGGNGLGLAIVSRIVKDHGGQFELTSTTGEGTRARITLPTMDG